MSLTRREAIGLSAAGLLAAGCGRVGEWVRGDERVEADPPAAAPERRLLDRFGYGPRPGDLAALRKMGTEAWFARQIEPDDQERAGLGRKLARLEINHLSPMELRDWPERAVLAQIQQAAVLRAAESPWQLRERMVEFWTDHFNVDARKGLGAFRKAFDDRKVIRTHALGSFPELLRATAKSPAMLVYLDQQASHAGHPNENYARELLELHTLGVDGGYSQRDVMEVARCFTGWSEQRGFLKARGAFAFKPELHDDGAKQVLGQTIPAGGGQADGELVLDVLLSHPATARNVSRRLSRFFVGDAWPRVAPDVEAAYRESNGDVKAMLRAIFRAPELVEGPPVLKRPFDFVVSAIRALDGDTDGRGLLPSLDGMGHGPFSWPMPDGYPLDTEAWTGTLLARWNFAHDLAHGRVPGVATDPEALARRTPGQTLADTILTNPQETLREVVATADPRAQAALCLASPEFQWK